MDNNQTYNYMDRMDSIREKFNEKFERDENNIILKNITMKEALKSQLQLHLEWSVLSSSIMNLSKELEQQREFAYSKAFDEKMSNKNRNVTAQEAKNYAQSRDDFEEYSILLNESIKLKTEIDAVLEVIKSRQYTLNKLSDLVIHSLEDYII